VCAYEIRLFTVVSSAAPVYHLGLFREKTTLQPVECVNLESFSRMKI
jgi:hypothetical protein